MVGMAAPDPWMKPATAAPTPVQYMVGTLSGPCGHHAPPPVPYTKNSLGAVPALNQLQPMVVKTVQKSHYSPKPATFLA